MTNQTDGLDAAGVAELKSCPFCGGESFLQRYESGHDEPNVSWIVNCKSCHARTQSLEEEQSDAIENWNRRSALVEAPAGEKPVDRFSSETINWSFHGGRLVKSDDGEWVRYADVAALASPAPDVAELKGENERLRRALKNLAYEMRHMLRANPEKDGGLYRQRLDEADAELSATFEECPHNCNEGGICLAEHSGYPKSCPVSTRNAGT